jgi:tetratricopeptide (TPR) repeat protein
VEDYTKALQLDNTDASNFNRRGDVYKLLGKRELAISDYKQAIKLAPKEDSYQKDLEKIDEDFGLAENLKTFKIGSDGAYLTENVVIDDVIRITASGVVTLGIFAGSSAPRGISGYENYSRVANLPHGCLMVRIGDSGKWEYVGPSTKIVAKSSGSLQFIINDADPSNNSGNYTVELTVKKK